MSNFKNNATLQKVANGGTISQADFTKALSDAGLGTFFVAHNDDANNFKGASSDAVDSISLSYVNNRSGNLVLSTSTDATLNAVFNVDANGGNGWGASNNSFNFHGDYGQNNWTAPGSTTAQKNQ